MNAATGLQCTRPELADRQPVALATQPASDPRVLVLTLPPLGILLHALVIPLA
jgi:hypothetical protein